MQDFEAHCLENREDWVRLLGAYAQAEEIARLSETATSKVTAPPAVSAALGSDAEAEESSTGWVVRIASIEGVETARMSTLHGRVIALGYLKFQLIDRQVGLRYRLTPSGKLLAQARPEIGEAAA